MPRPSRHWNEALELYKQCLLSCLPPPAEIPLEKTTNSPDTLRMSAKTQESFENAGPIIKEGWLFKEGGAARSKWQNRYFRLCGDQMFYFNRKEDKNSLGSLNLSEAVDISKIGEHSGKRFCVTIVGSKGNSKKVYYLAADTEDILNEWYAAMKTAVTNTETKQNSLTKYATAEIFLTSGIRISGDVQYNILAFLSQRVGPEKKHRDNLGWFCDREVPLQTVLTIFAQYGWNPEKIYRSSAQSGTESSIQPVIRVMFCKKPEQPVVCESSGTSSAESSKGSTPSIARRGLGSFKDYMTRLIADSGLADSGSASSNHVDAKPPAPPVTASDLGELVEGADDELIELMREFDIPLSLLQIH